MNAGGVSVRQKQTSAGGRGGSPLGRVVRAALAVLALAACGGNDIVLPDEGEPAEIAAVGGNEQSRPAGNLLPDSLTVKVTDVQDRPVFDVPVTFVVTAGGGTVSPATARTDASGQARAAWVLGPAAGAQAVAARVQGDGATLSATFTATATAGTATTIAIESGNAQSGTAGSPLAAPLVVVVTDAQNNPVEGVGVTWTAAEGSGQLSATTTSSGPDGRTSVTWTLGPTPGAQSVTAAAAGLSGSPLAFTATSGVGAAGKIAILTAPPSSAQSGSAFTSVPQVRLLDASNNPVNTTGAAITAVLNGPAGGTLVGTDTRGTSNGVATFTGLGIQGPSGTYTITFSGANLTGVTSGPIAVSSGSATRLVIVPGTVPSTASSGVPLSPAPQVRLVDAAGNPVAQANVAIRATETASGVSLAGTVTRSTDASGVATFSDLALIGSGNSNVSILFAADGLPGVSSPNIGLGLGPSTTSLSASKGTSVVGEAYTVTVSVAGPGNTPTGTVQVSDGAGATCSVSLSGGAGSCALTSGVAGPKSLTATYSGDSQHGGSSGSIAHQVDRAGTTTAITATSPNPSTAGQAVRVSVRVSAVAPGAGTPTGSVSVSGGGGACTIELSGGTGSCELTPTTVGQVPLAASYSGDGNFSASVGGGTQTVNPAASDTEITAIAPEPSFVGQEYTVSVRVTGGAGGAVQVSDGEGASCSAPLTGETGSCVLVSSSEGGKTITAVYPPTGGASGSQDMQGHQVVRAGTTVGFTLNPANPAAGQQVTVNVSVTSGTNLGPITGSVSVSSPQAGNCTIDDISTSSSCILPTPVGSGQLDVTVQYQGSPRYEPDSESSSQQIAAIPTTTSIASDSPDPSTVGADVLVAVTVSSSSGTPAGAVRVTGGGDECTITLADGGGSCTLQPGVAGDDVAITAEYLGQAPHAGSSDTEPHRVDSPNGAPNALGDAFETSEDEPLAVPAAGVLANDTDPEGGALAAVPAAGVANGVLTLSPAGGFGYTPAADFNGADLFTYRARDPAGTLSAPATVVLSVRSVNDPPSFVAGGDVVTEDRPGRRTVSGWATAVSPGPADESGQSVSFVVATDDDAAFVRTPEIDADGNLGFDPAPVAGADPVVVTVTVRAVDSGGTAGGGNDTSLPQTFTITITP